MIIRKEKPKDIPAITRINREAFPTDAEAKLVEELRQNEKITLSLVALVNDQPVGHILFSPMTVISPSGKTTALIGLGPAAVLPENQQHRVGSALCERGIAMIREAGHKAILVLGHPSYYPRFGFHPASQFNITCSYEVPEDAFMALELQEGALGGISGIAHYQPEFDTV